MHLSSLVLTFITYTTLVLATRDNEDRTGNLEHSTTNPVQHRLEQLFYSLEVAWNRMVVVRHDIINQITLTQQKLSRESTGDDLTTEAAELYKKLQNELKKAEHRQRDFRSYWRQLRELDESGTRPATVEEWENQYQIALYRYWIQVNTRPIIGSTEDLGIRNRLTDEKYADLDGRTSESIFREHASFPEFAPNGNI